MSEGHPHPVGHRGLDLADLFQKFQNG